MDLGDGDGGRREGLLGGSNLVLWVVVSLRWGLTGRDLHIYRIS